MTRRGRPTGGRPGRGGVLRCRRGRSDAGPADRRAGGGAASCRAVGGRRRRRTGAGTRRRARHRYCAATPAGSRRARAPPPVPARGRVHPGVGHRRRGPALRDERGLPRDPERRRRRSPCGPAAAGHRRGVVAPAGHAHALPAGRLADLPARAAVGEPVAAGAPRGPDRAGGHHRLPVLDGLAHRSRPRRRGPDRMPAAAQGDGAALSGLGGARAAGRSSPPPGPPAPAPARRPGRRHH